MHERENIEDLEENHDQGPANLQTDKTKQVQKEDPDKECVKNKINLNENIIRKSNEHIQKSDECGKEFWQKTRTKTPQKKSHKDRGDQVQSNSEVNRRSSPGHYKKETAQKEAVDKPFTEENPGSKEDPNNVEDPDTREDPDKKEDSGQEKTTGQEAQGSTRRHCDPDLKLILVIIQKLQRGTPSIKVTKTTKNIITLCKRRFFKRDNEDSNNVISFQYGRAEVERTTNEHSNYVISFQYGRAEMGYINLPISHVTPVRLGSQTV